MSLSERPEHEARDNRTSDFSLSKFFHDAYDKGIVKAVEEHPKEAAFTVIGAAAAGAAAVYLSRGGGVAELFAFETREKAGQTLMPASKKLLDFSPPTNCFNRVADGAFSNADSWRPVARGAAGYIEAATGSGADRAITESMQFHAVNGYRAPNIDAETINKRIGRMLASP